MSDAQTPFIDIGPYLMTPSCEKLFGALARAQMQMGPLTKSNTARIPGKDGKAGYSYDYADLADTIETCRPHLGAEGLSIIQAPVTTARGVEVSTMIAHESGQWLMIKPLHMPTGNSPQALGSAITYARRYQYQPAVGLAAEDDDGGKAEASPPPKPKRSPPIVPDTDDKIGPRCSGKAKRLGDGIDDKCKEIAEATGKTAVSVLAWAMRESEVDREIYQQADGRFPRPWDLSVDDGTRVRDVLAAKLAGLAPQDTDDIDSMRSDDGETSPSPDLPPVTPSKSWF